MGHDKKTVSAGFCAMAAILLLCLPFRWVAAAAIAAAVHEMGHIFAIWLFSGRSVAIRFHAFSARLSIPGMGSGKELCCALAGPAAGLFLLIFGRSMPRVAICALGQTAYNLLPIFPLDGGRALRCFASIFMAPPAAQKLCATVAVICRVTVIISGIALTCLTEFGSIPLLVAAIIAIPRK